MPAISSCTRSAGRGSKRSSRRVCWSSALAGGGGPAGPFLRAPGAGRPARSPTTPSRAHGRKADGTPTPTYRCLFPEPPPPGTVPACAEAGILGALTGVLGSLMALEVIREIVGFGEGLVGRLLMFDARAMRFETLQYAWDPSNPLSGEHPTIKDLSLHA